MPGLNKSWLKFCPFCLHESEQNEAKDFYAQKAPFSTNHPN
jgi:hypothetical protein